MGDPGDGAPLSKVKSYQWPTGHVAHISSSQAEALDRFKKLCEEKGYYRPGDGDKVHPTHDDETLLRFLRARKFVPQDAFVQFKDTEEWRKENQLEKLYRTIDVDEYDEVRELYTMWTGRRDKRGLPLYVYQIGDVNAKAVAAYSSGKDKKGQSTNTKTPWRLLKLFALYENLCRFIFPLCSALPDRPNPETPVSQSNNIVDLTGVGFTKLWNLRSHMGDASNLATSHYPETLDRIFIIGAPSYFPTIWGWAQRWFDPITVSKIFILTPKNITSTLEKFIDIDNIPKKYGGNLDWQFGDMPHLDKEMVEALQWKENFEDRGYKTLPKGPIKWQYEGEDLLVATAIGSEGGKPRSREIASLHIQPGLEVAFSAGRVDETDVYQSTSAATSPNNSVAVSNSAKPKMSDDANLNVGKDPDSSLQPSSRAGTYTVPYKDNTNDISSPPADGRQGTSSTRFEQQAGTHAEGQLADGTPAVRTEGLGDRTAVMDPGTVGQAPKEHPLPDNEEQPSVIEQAKDMANQAVEQAKELSQTAMEAVGMKQAEPAAEEVVKKEDPAIDSMSGKNVEEFLRSQTASKPAS